MKNLKEYRGVMNSKLKSTSINKLLILSIIALSLISCSDLLTEEPQTFIAEDQFFSSEGDAIAATLAVYEPLQRNTLYGRLYVRDSEIMSDNAFGRASDLTNYQHTPTYGGTRWSVLYESIQRANVVIAKVPDINMNPDVKEQLVAEARFVRAWAYYILVRTFGGVPLHTTPIEDLDNLHAPRSSIDEVYDLIIEDFQVGEMHLPGSYSQQSELGRATKWAAKTFLADVYLTMERWDDARAKAKEIIDSGEFSLVRVNSSEDFAQIYGPDVVTHSEDILSIHYTRDAPGNQLLPSIHHAGAGYSSAGWNETTGEGNSWLQEWDQEDLRRNWNLYNPDTNDAAFISEQFPFPFRKFRDPNAVASNRNGNNFPIKRYPEALLIFAEATSQANGGPTMEALEAVNQVRRRAYGLDPNLSAPDVDLSSDLSAEAFRDAVIMERAKEFLLECKRWYDLVRTNTAIEVIQGMGRPIQEHHILWPIPTIEIDNNDLITQDDQNPGW